MPEVASELPGAIDRGEISAWFQPQLDLHSGAIVAAEALCRWHHPVLGEISPTEFIPLAEQIGMIDALGRFMADESMRAAAEWSRLRQPIEVSVNVSPVQLLTPEFTDYITSRFRRAALRRNALTLEITESLRIHNFPVVVRRLDALRDLGVDVALDDFGTGHSSVTQARRIHATELKIDRSLVIDDSAASTSMLSAVIGEVHDSGLRVVAEGVETALQLDRVRALGCDRVQGFLIGRPQPKREFEALVA